MTDEKKVISLLRYIRETYDDKYKAVLNLEGELWYKFLDDINLNNRFIYFRREDGESDVVFKITRPYSQKTQDDIKVQRIFRDFRDIYYKLENESHLYELMFANGILMTKHNDEICHPLIYKRANIEFDSAKDSISIKDTDVDTKLNTKLLSLVDSVNHLELKNIMEEVEKNYCHPFDLTGMDELLKGIAKRLHFDGSYFSDYKDYSKEKTGLVIINRPLFFLRNREVAFVKNLDGIIEKLESGLAVNKALLRLTGVNAASDSDKNNVEDMDEKIERTAAESSEILFSKEANKEQLEVAKRIRNYDTVLVQGPPGTGKTHTIANLVGDFLSKGKSVLIASRTKKALSVLKDMADDAIRPLIVSSIDDNNEDLEKSIDGITDFISNHSIEELYEKKEKLAKDRDLLIKKLMESRKKVFNIKLKEIEPVKIGEEEYSPIEAAKFVAENCNDLDYIPGEVKLYEPLPLSEGDIDFLYKSNIYVSADEEKELKRGICNPSMILDPNELKKTMTELEEAELKASVIKSEAAANISLKDRVYLDQVALYSGNGDFDFDDIRQKIKSIKDEEDFLNWEYDAVLAGKKERGEKESYIRLKNLIVDLNAYYERNIEHIKGKRAEYDTSMNRKELADTLEEIRKKLSEGKKISSLTKFFKPQWKKVFKTFKINGEAVYGISDIDDAICNVIFDIKLREVESLYNELITKKGGAEFDREKLINEGEIHSYFERINYLLRWYDDNIRALIKMMQDKGISANEIFRKKTLSLPVDELKKDIAIIKNELSGYLDLIYYYEGKYIKAKNKIDATKEYLRAGEDEKSDLLNMLNNAIDTKYFEEYEEQYNILKKTHDKLIILERRRELLSKIGEVAPTWRDFIENRFGIHAKGETPPRIKEAWLYKQFKEIIESITKEPYEKLQKMISWYGKELRNISRELVKNTSWYMFMNELKDDISKKQALQGFSLTLKKIGKGTGKGAASLKREAQELLKRCRKAVPAWIMTVDRALETLDAGESFDYLIIDEASQCDISSIPILQFAKKAIIVGDDEQVSPSPVGIDYEKTEKLIDMYIRDKVSNAHLYDMNSSLYDILKTSFPVLTLKEHFRCVPKIINYSNLLSYDGMIKPLRESSSSPLKPSLQPVKTNGVLNDDKINEEEAKLIVEKIKEINSDPIYDGMSIGVISLKYEEQAKYIEKMLIENLSLQDYDKRRILCGRPQAFQGDERDVIFLSMCDSNSSNEPLKLMNEGNFNINRKRFNVAVSRAKDQIFLYYSLDENKDLKSSDIRKELIDYFKNPSENMGDESPGDERLTEFERDIKNELLKRNYDVRSNVEAGLYNIALVVYKDGKKIIIDAEGDRYRVDEDEIIADMEKEDILQRVGWKFAGIRSTKYYSNKEEAIKELISDLK